MYKSKELHLQGFSIISSTSQCSHTTTQVLHKIMRRKNFDKTATLFVVTAVSQKFHSTCC